MKKILNLIICTLLVLTATSCIKDWQCECSDGVRPAAIVQTYPKSKLLDAQKKCEEVQTNLRKLNSQVSCKIK